MRLIDADRLKNKITGITKPHEFVEEIDKRPTVKAVPVEWIKKQLKKQEYRKLLIDYIEWSSCLEWLIDTWEEENG